jgi:D-glucosaminate-6-phosphate ammonia-lyase
VLVSEIAMSLRRTFLQRLAATPLLASFAPSSFAASKGRDVFKELGVRTFINAAGTFTTMTASLMPPEVMDAMVAASKNYVDLIKLQDKVGERIAAIVAAESAMVTSGAAGALTCGTAGCLTGTDRKAIQQLPDLTGLKSEVLIQKSHRYGYDHAVRAVGIRMVEIETAEELERAVNDKTAMMLFFNDAEPKGQIKGEEWVALGKKHKVPTFVDSSADVPPVTNLTKFTKMGYDLVTFSGGKGIRGPQSAGILAGRKDLIQAARLNTSPYSDSVSRGMKVNKEEMVGMLTALELFVKKDHEAEWKEWERRIRTIVDSVRDVPSIQTETYVPPIANHVPHLRVKWDPSKVSISPVDVKKRLQEGEPSIEVNPGTNKDELIIGVWMMQPGEAEIVARRVRAVLKA